MSIPRSDISIKQKSGKYFYFDFLSANSEATLNCRSRLLCVKLIHTIKVMEDGWLQSVVMTLLSIFLQMSWPSKVVLEILTWLDSHRLQKGYNFRIRIDY